MPLEFVKIWKEGSNILIRSDVHHITTYGKSLKEALANFNEAYALAVGQEAEPTQEQLQSLTISISIPSLVGSYGREITNNIRKGAYPSAQ